MRGFILKVSFFLSPFLVLLTLGNLLYSRSGGDLNRLGKVSYPKDYRNQFKNAFNRANTWVSFSELNSIKTTHFDIFTIGDSFSNTEGSTYQNHFEELGFKVLNFDREKYVIEDYNPAKLLYKLVLNGYLDSIKVDYVILQIIERNFIRDVKGMFADESSLFKTLQKNEIEKIKESNLRTHLNDIMLYYRFKIFYLFSDRAFQSQVYKFTLKKPMFSVNERQLICYAKDISNIAKVNNKSMNEVESNLIKLKKLLLDKGIKLIVFPAPDKYDVYYDFIEDNGYPKNPFFEKLSSFNNAKLVVNSKEIFQPYLKNGIRDLYLADDTHWSPKGAKIVAEYLTKIILNDNRN